MFCCRRSQLRLRSLAILGILISGLIATFHVLLDRKVIQFWSNAQYEDYFLSFRFNDIIIAFLLFLGCVLIFVRSLRVPPRIVTAVDIYNDMTNTRQSNLRGYDAYGHEADLIDFSSEFNKDCNEATFNAAIAKTGVDDVKASSARIARLVLPLSIGFGFSSIVSRVVYTIQHDTYYKMRFSEYGFEYGTYAFILFYFLSVLFVLYGTDPALIPIMSPRSIDNDAPTFIAPDALSFLSDVPGVPHSTSNIGSTNRPLLGSNGQSGGVYNENYGHNDFYDNHTKPGSLRTGRNPRY